MTDPSCALAREINLMTSNSLSLILECTKSHEAGAILVLTAIFIVIVCLLNNDVWPVVPVDASFRQIRLAFPALKF